MRICKAKVKMTTEIPDIVIGRLPVYLRALTHLAEKGQTTTSSHELGQRLGISSAQIRKDLSHFGEFGKQGTGYHINFLIDQLRKILHLNVEWRIAVVGAGYLGHALAHYQGFQQRGFRVAWVFDNDPERVGEAVNGVTVQHIDKMVTFLRTEHVQMALLAVPTDAAQMTADMLVEAGVKAILSYAPINLKVPKDVQVQYSDPVVQMQRMTYYLDTTKDATPEA
jgi:redox-sensing transcriptional repressor